MTAAPERLASENVIINAPMSFSGSAQRAWRLRRGTTGGRLALMTALAVLLLAVWWPAIAIWYLVFGIFLVPYRLLRRGSRKRKAERLRHQEMLAAVKSRSDESGRADTRRRPA
jgi:hypothetical protein